MAAENRLMQWSVRVLLKYALLFHLFAEESSSSLCHFRL